MDGGEGWSIRQAEREGRSAAEGLDEGSKVELRETVRLVTRVADQRATSLLSMHFCINKQTYTRLRETIHRINQTL